MRRRVKAAGMMMIGSLRSAGITTYMRNGQIITRVSNSMQRRSNTIGQFKQRQRMRQTIALWRNLKYCDVMFTMRSTPYQNFASLANRLPAVYVPRMYGDISLLRPGIPVSDGTLPVINQKLGEVNGVPALITDLGKDDITYNDRFRLYIAVQEVSSGRATSVKFSMRKISLNELSLVDGKFVLKGDEFANEMMGWALVRVNGDNCSAQGIVTRCTYYKKYTTDEALQETIKDYKGLTGIY